MNAPGTALVLFARAPELGRVKTRLALDVGAARALEIYRELAEGVIGAVRGSATRMIVRFTPANAADEMHRWLGDGLAYEPQCDGDLGARMHDAIEVELAAGAERVIVIGTDCPTVTADTIAQALAALDECDVVFGPAEDGGYYLVGTRATAPGLFHDMPWSSEQVLPLSLERAAASGLRVSLLARMRDVDTGADWAAHEARRAREAADQSRSPSGR